MNYLFRISSFLIIKSAINVPDSLMFIHASSFTIFLAVPSSMHQLSSQVKPPLRI